MIRVHFAKPKVKVFLNAAKWEEEKHPRAKDGKFRKGGGSGKSEEKKEPKQVRVKKTGKKIKIRETPKQDISRIDLDEKWPKIEMKYDGDNKYISIEDGKFVFHVPPVFYGYESDVRAHKGKQINDLLSPLPDNVYVRSVINKDDYEHLKDGTHRGSINHATGEEEGGLSVGKDFEFPAKYAYFLEGPKVGTGTDGEPLLDTDKAKPIGSIMRYEDAASKYNEMQDEYIKNTFNVDPKKLQAYFARVYLDPGDNKPEGR